MLSRSWNNYKSMCDALFISTNLSSSILAAENRRSFSIRKFAAKYELQLVAGNFYLAQYDPTSDEVARQLGFRR